MIRLSEEQRGILSCYSGTKEHMIAELRKAIPFIEDAELREESEGFADQLKKMTNHELVEESGNGLMVFVEKTYEKQKRNW